MFAGGDTGSPGGTGSTGGTVVVGWTRRSSSAPASVASVASVRSIDSGGADPVVHVRQVLRAEVAQRGEHRVGAFWPSPHRLACCM